VLLWKGKALRLLGLYTATRDTLTAAFRRVVDRDIGRFRSSVL